MKTWHKSFLFAAALPMATTVSLLTFARCRANPKNKKYRSIVVLGTAQYNGVPSRQFAARLQWAARLWRQNRNLEVIAVGGKLPTDAYSEAEVARTYLLVNRVEPDAIRTVPIGNDTQSSLRAARDKIPQPTILVTDPLHGLRAKWWAHTLGIQARVSTTAYSPTRFPGKSWWKSLSHEQGGLVVLAVENLLGAPKARALEEKLRRLQARLDPTRAARHQALRAEAGKQH